MEQVISVLGILILILLFWIIRQRQHYQRRIESLESIVQSSKHFEKVVVVRQTAELQHQSDKQQTEPLQPDPQLQSSLQLHSGRQRTFRDRWNNRGSVIDNAPNSIKALDYALNNAHRELDYAYSELNKALNKRIEFSYTDTWWQVYSNWFKEKKGWRCEQCGLPLRFDRIYLDTHHIKGIQYNEPKDLKALCIGCHAKQKKPTDHSFMKDSDRYKNFKKKYR